MGLLSGIGKAIGGIWGGVKKVYHKVMGFFGKIAGSKWGKILLIAAAVFTAGVALIAAGSAMAATTGGFMAKFVAGGKAFMTALASPIGTAKNLAGGAATAGQSAAAGAAITGSNITALPIAGEAAAGASMDLLASGAGAAAGGGAVGPPSSLANAAKTVATNTPPPPPPMGMLGKAADVAGKAVGGAAKFAQTTGGGLLLSNIIQGYAAGGAQEEWMKEQERVRRYYDDQWADPEKLAKLQSAAEDPISVNSGYLDRARRVNDFFNGRNFNRAPGNPSDVYGSYVTGPGG